MSTILTLRLDDAAQAHFNALRQRYYPPALNLIDAHLTLFHQLPSAPEITAELLAAASRPVFSLPVTGVRSLGRGVAYKLASPKLLALHRSLAAAFAEHLIPQDRQPLQPHIVVQNKATQAEARELLAVLQAGFQAFEVQATGLDLWRYLGGPWEHLRTFPFST